MSTRRSEATLYRALMVRAPRSEDSPDTLNAMRLTWEQGKGGRKRWMP